MNQNNTPPLSSDAMATYDSLPSRYKPCDRDIIGRDPFVTYELMMLIRAREQRKARRQAFWTRCRSFFAWKPTTITPQ